MAEFPIATTPGARQVSSITPVPALPFIVKLPRFLVGETVQLKPEYLFPKRGLHTGLPTVNYVRERPEMKVVAYKQEESAVYCALVSEQGESYIEPFDENTLVVVTSKAE